MKIISKRFMCHMDLLMALTFDEFYIMINSLEETLQCLYTSRMPTKIHQCRVVRLCCIKIELKKCKTF